jgi:hypothetical protein
MNGESIFAGDPFEEEILRHLEDPKALLKEFNQLKQKLNFTFEVSEVPKVVIEILRVLEKFPDEENHEKENLAACYSELILTLKDKLQNCNDPAAKRCVDLVRKSIEEKGVVFQTKLKTEVVQPTREGVEECITDEELDALLARINPARASEEMSLKAIVQRRKR